MPSIDQVAAVAVDGAAAPDQLQQLLLAHLAGDAEGTARLSVPDLLEQALGDNPLAAPLAAALRKRQGSAQAESDDAFEVEGADDSFETEDSTVADVLRRLYGEVEALRVRTGLLADALGACPRCWGEHVACPRCHGRGQPGGRSPDPVLFDSLVAPAVQRRRRDTARASSEVDAKQPPLSGCGRLEGGNHVN